MVNFYFLYGDDKTTGGLSKSDDDLILKEDKSRNLIVSLPNPIGCLTRFIS